MLARIRTSNRHHGEELPEAGTASPEQEKKRKPTLQVQRERERGERLYFKALSERKVHTREKSAKRSHRGEKDYKVLRIYVMRGIQRRREGEAMRNIARGGDCYADTESLREERKETHEDIQGHSRTQTSRNPTFIGGGRISTPTRGDL